MKGKDRIKKGRIKPKKPKKGEETSDAVCFSCDAGVGVTGRVQSSPQVIQVTDTYLFLTSRGGSRKVRKRT